MTIFEINIFGINFAPSYYGLMYAIGFLLGFYIIKKRGKILPLATLDDMFIYIFLGVVLGGRLGYVLFYNLSDYISNPLNIIKVWEGGMSFHGGVIGVILAMLLFSKKYKVSFLKLADQVTLVLPIGLGLGRIGNYLNKELLGYSGYEGMFAVYINGTGYFPSPLVESILEGLILFIILNTLYYLNTISTCRITKKPIKYGFDGQIASLFLILYAVFRIGVEIFFRSPDSHIGYILGYFTMGELLTLPMLILGIYIYRKLKINNEVELTKTNTLLKLIRKDIDKIRKDIDEIDDYLLLLIQEKSKNGIDLNEKDYNFIVNKASSKQNTTYSNYGDSLNPLIELLSKRFEKVKEIGKIKAKNNIVALQQGRWDEVLQRVTYKSRELLLNEKLIIIFWNMIHEKALELENDTI